MPETIPQFDRPYCPQCGYPCLPAVERCTECGRPIDRLLIPHPATLWTPVERTRVIRTIRTMYWANLVAVIIWMIAAWWPDPESERALWTLLAVASTSALGVICLATKIRAHYGSQSHYASIARRIRHFARWSAACSFFSWCLLALAFAGEWRDQSREASSWPLMALYLTPYAALFACFFWYLAASAAADTFHSAPPVPKSRFPQSEIAPQTFTPYLALVLVFQIFFCPILLMPVTALMIMTLIGWQMLLLSRESTRCRALGESISAVPKGS